MDPLFILVERLSINLRAVDLLDVVVIAGLVYLFLLWLRQAASRALLLTVLLLLALYAASRTLDMYLTQLVFQIGFTAIVLGLVLVFQEDIRRGLERLTAWRAGTHDPVPQHPSRTIDVLAESIAKLAELKMGALLVFRGREVLDRHLRGGVPVGAELSLPLLQSIFDPHSPGHDGAVLVHGHQLEMLGVHLPLSENLDEVGDGGTRHSAALGLAERSDALVVVVSEERGTISVAQGERLERMGSAGQLHRRLEAYYETLFPTAKRHWSRWLTHNLALKGTALLLAGMLWAVYAYRFETVQHTFVALPVYRGLPEGWGVDTISLQVTVSGSERAFRMLRRERLTLAIDMDEAEVGPKTITFAEDKVDLPRGLQVTQIVPSSARLTVYRAETRTVPVQVRFEGELPPQLELVSVQVDPPEVPVSIRIDGTQLPEQSASVLIDLAELSPTPPVQSIERRLSLPADMHLIDAADSRARVTMRVAQREAQPEAAETRRAARPAERR